MKLSKIAAQTAGALGAGLVGLGVWDATQKKHTILRNFPVLGHARFAFEKIRPEIHQYFIESNTDGRPFDRDTRTIIYERAKGVKSEKSFGTERDVMSEGYEFLVHSVLPVPEMDPQPRVRIGGPQCTQPYEAALMNVSAMSFGSLSANAIRSLNKGAALGGFAHDTGEGGMSSYHLENGGDLIWELGTGYFGARTPEGDFDPEKFAQKAKTDAVKMVSLKLSQGAKPGIGGVLPGAKVTEEIAEIRGVAPSQTVISPAGHKVFSTPRGLIEFIGQMRELAGGKPAGFKMCVSSRAQVLAICKAMIETGITPDFIIVDGSEGGTGAAPLEFEDHVGVPLSEGLMIWHNALMGSGLRDRIRIGASGKVAAANDIIKLLIQGADFTLSARSMMMALGCIQAQKCHTDKCPTGVATQDKWLQRGLVVEEKSVRVANYQRLTIKQVVTMLAAMGVDDLDQLQPWMLRRVVEYGRSRSYEELYVWLKEGSLLDGTAGKGWMLDFQRASADTFRSRTL